MEKSRSSHRSLLNSDRTLLFSISSTPTPMLYFLSCKKGLATITISWRKSVPHVSTLDETEPIRLTSQNLRPFLPHRTLPILDFVIHEKTVNGKGCVHARTLPILQVDPIGKRGPCPFYPVSRSALPSRKPS